MTNRPLYLGVALGAIFILIFAVTTVILMTVTPPPGPAVAPAERAPTVTRPMDREAWDRPLSPPPQTGPAETTARQGRHGLADGRPPGTARPDPHAQWRDNWPLGAGASGTPGSGFAGYRFRPLEERELRRLEQQSYVDGDWSTDWSRQPRERSGEGAAPSGSWQDEDWGTAGEWMGYRFRPLDPPRTQASPRPDQPTQPYPWVPSEPYSYPLAPLPQWGVAPPPRALPERYPALSPRPDRRLV